MDMVDRLLEKYGTNITVNGTQTRAHIDGSVTSTEVKRTSARPFLTMMEILTKELIPLDAEIRYNSHPYRVYDRLDAPTINGEVKYCDTMLYLDDFIHDITISKQSLSQDGCNLPSQKPSYMTAKARIRTIRPEDTLQYSMYGKKPPTHHITIHYADGISAGDLIEWEDRNFEILAIENPDELNRFLVFDCIEVL